MKRLAISSLGLVLAVLLLACGSDDDDPDSRIELSAGSGGATMSCLAFDPAILAEMPMAFEATAKSVEGERVTLSVERWFKGGTADEVVLDAPAGLEALIGGISFEVDGRYLISATDGVVNYCGFSGEATPELTSGFEAAFGG